MHIELAKSDNLSQDQAEFRELVTSAGVSIAELITGKREVPEPKYFIGSGKAEEVRSAVLAHKPEVVIFNHFLSPAQERNLEKFLNCHVLDRTNLILEIFAARARSFEGKLQVQLAQLEHQSTRLVRGWTHLERQRGGIGLRGGPGETQLEVDRRILRQKITHLKKRLAKLAEQRVQNRRSRKRAAIPTVALVGYTNAGKSTLFNHLTTANVYVADKLFATLDPTLRRVSLPGFGPAIVADTVGFIRDLPHELVEAFHATLEETKEADLLLHVIDASDPLRSEKIIAVEKVLAEIGAESVPCLHVYNKIDLLTDTAARIDINANNQPQRVWLSAVTGEGTELLFKAIARLLATEIEEIAFSLLPNAGQIRAALYERQAVITEEIMPAGQMSMTVHMRRSEFERLINSSSNSL